MIRLRQLIFLCLILGFSSQVSAQKEKGQQVLDRLLASSKADKQLQGDSCALFEYKVRIYPRDKSRSTIKDYVKLITNESHSYVENDAMVSCSDPENTFVCMKEGRMVVQYYGSEHIKKKFKSQDVLSLRDTFLLNLNLTGYKEYKSRDSLQIGLISFLNPNEDKNDFKELRLYIDLEKMQAKKLQFIMHSSHMVLKKELIVLTNRNDYVYKFPYRYKDEFLDENGLLKGKYKYYRLVRKKVDEKK